MAELEVMQRAKMYMDKLAQGIDPISGCEMSEDSTLNNCSAAHHRQRRGRREQAEKSGVSDNCTSSCSAGSC